MRKKKEEISDEELQKQMDRVRRISTLYVSFVANHLDDVHHTVNRPICKGLLLELYKVLSELMYIRDAYKVMLSVGMCVHSNRKISKKKRYEILKETMNALDEMNLEWFSRKESKIEAVLTGDFSDWV